LDQGKRIEKAVLQASELSFAPYRWAVYTKYNRVDILGLTGVEVKCIV